MDKRSKVLKLVVDSVIEPPADPQNLTYRSFPIDKESKYSNVRKHIRELGTTLDRSEEILENNKENLLGCIEKKKSNCYR